MTPQQTDSIYNKGRDIEKVHIKNSPQYLDFTLIHRHIFNEPGRLNLFITLDIDTMDNSGRISLPEDTMTKVSKKCAWEYCIYVNDYDYGYYNQNNSKISKPFGMLVVKTPGPSGIIKVKISKSLINNPDAIRYTIATFAPSQPPNLDTLFQGGSSAVDVFPGTKETFGGKINGYGESTPLGDGMTSNYTIYYLYNGINPIAEYAPNGSVLARYIYAGGLHIAKVAGADTHWYHCDALGSPRKMTDERGSTVWSATYYPFGEMTAGSNNTHGFTGKEFDSEMGLNYFCQRYYDPEIGRFTTLDPQNSPTASPYAYCANCPLVFIDPTGETMWPRENPDYGAHGTNDTFCPFYGGYNWGLFGNSAQMDPDFWGTGWDYYCNDPLVKQALLWLSMMEWDVLTWSGWRHINIGNWIKANNINIWIWNEALMDPNIGGFTTSTYDKTIVMNNILSDNLTLFTSVLAHEATHKFLAFSDSRYRNVESWSPGWTNHEIIAYSVQIDLFGKAVAVEQVNHWRGMLITYLFWRAWDYRFPN